MTEPNPADVLAPCPFCGSSKIQIKTGGAGNWFIECGGCGLTTDDRGYERTIAAWNTRAGQQAQPTPDAMHVTDKMVDRALLKWRGHLQFHTTGDENGDPVFKSTALEAMRAALIAALEDKHA